VGGSVLSELALRGPAIIGRAQRWEIVQQENFRTILYLISVDSIEQASGAERHSVWSSSSLFTRSLQHGELYLSHRGNDLWHAISTSARPCGDRPVRSRRERHRGGSEAGSDAWKAYMRARRIRSLSSQLRSRKA